VLAATTDLATGVQVRHGIARFTRVVATFDDAENAEEVASRVPAVAVVSDALEVAEP